MTKPRLAACRGPHPCPQVGRSSEPPPTACSARALAAQALRPELEQVPSKGAHMVTVTWALERRRHKMWGRQLRDGLPGHHPVAAVRTPPLPSVPPVLPDPALPPPRAGPPRAPRPAPHASHGQLPTRPPDGLQADGGRVQPWSAAHVSVRPSVLTLPHLTEGCKSLSHLHNIHNILIIHGFIQNCI